jgi:hypothetical protein
MEFSKERVLESWIILNKTGTSEQRKLANVYLSEFQVKINI